MWGLSKSSIVNEETGKYNGMDSFFGGTPPLEESVGWILCIGFGGIFCLITLGMVWLDQKYVGTEVTSEQFNTAGRSVKIGLTAAVIVSQWTWAATLLQSSNVAFGFGVSGPFWYASGATIQVLLFGILAVELKKKARKCHTVCELVYVRWGGLAHKVFLVFCFLANIIVTAMLVLGGAATVNALTGMDVYAAGFLIPIFVIPYTMAGGLKATFMSSYFHTAIIFAILVSFVFTVYVKKYGSDKVYDMLAITTSYTDDECKEIFSTDGTAATTFWEKGKYACGKVKGNQDGSYLTMISIDGLRFGIINIVGNFGTVFVDQSYWQSAIAAKPAAAHKGYLLGGMVWFTIPFALATAMGLSGLALQLPITSTEAGKGLVPPAVATHLFGSTGSWMIAIMLFMAIVSTGSAESIAVSSLVSYDMYRHYVNPKADGPKLLKVGRISILVWGLFMGVLSAFLQYLITISEGLGLGWVYTFMGNAIGSAVPPLWFLLTWDKANATGAILGAVGGLVCAITAWIIHSSALKGGLTVANLGALDSCLTGNVIAIGASTIIHVVLSYMSPQNFDWKKFDDPEEGIKMLEQDMSGLADEDYEPEELAAASSWIYKYGAGLSFVLVVVWPILSLPAGTFTKDYFAFWVFVAIMWGFCATLIIVALPIAESMDGITAVLYGIMGKKVPAKK